jgi:hypothetical protein
MQLAEFYKLPRSHINAWHSSGLQASYWRLATNHVVVFSTYSPPRCVHSCHLSGNFWIGIGYQISGLPRAKSATPPSKWSLLGNFLPHSVSSILLNRVYPSGPSLENTVDVTRRYIQERQFSYCLFIVVWSRTVMKQQNLSCPFSLAP